jgi:hypothetical protein
MSARRMFLIVVVVFIVGTVAIQVVPVERTNPPVTRQINWDSPETEALARTACMDCHSNETVWPWYSYVAPVSWLVAHDVNEGRAQMNMSTGRGEVEGGDMARQIQRGNMPPQIYLILHPDARLNADQQAQLIAGLEATFGREGGR